MVAWNILQDDYDDDPELVPASDHESNDDTDWEPYRPQFQATIALSPDADDVTLICGPTTDDADLFLYFDFNHHDCCSSSYDIPVPSTSCSEEVSHISHTLDDLLHHLRSLDASYVESLWTRILIYIPRNTMIIMSPQRLPILQGSITLLLFQT